ncbi:IS4 family transposase [Streptomyces laurentii]|uniref:IS4 family transposase n=1 Tax=Streptomyces laurentii TaxID=39478 RepID=A0A169PN90_STRLU|nr:IS4 family transposase [Streptomyces laurentii]
MFTALLAQVDAESDLVWAVAVDSTIVRAQQHAAGPGKRGPTGEPQHHALGRSRSGLTTKIHLAVDGRCRPLTFVLTPGQAGDAPASTEVMARIHPGQPRQTAHEAGCGSRDKAYSSRAIRAYLWRHGTRTVIPQPADQDTGLIRRPLCTLCDHAEGIAPGVTTVVQIPDDAANTDPRITPPVRKSDASPSSAKHSSKRKARQPKEDDRPVILSPALGAGQAVVDKSRLIPPAAHGLADTRPLTETIRGFIRRPAAEPPG